MGNTYVESSRGKKGSTAEQFQIPQLIGSFNFQQIKDPGQRMFKKWIKILRVSHTTNKSRTNTDKIAEAFTDVCAERVPQSMEGVMQYYKKKESG
jgi:hypothetical protein